MRLILQKPKKKIILKVIVSAMAIAKTVLAQSERVYNAVFKYQKQLNKYECFLKIVFR